MSAGEFQNAVYETNAGNFAAILVQPETLACTINSVANGSAGGAVNQEASARATGGKASTGIIARTVTLAWTGTIPDGYDPNGRLTIPALTPAFYNACNPNDPAAVGTYLGQDVEVVGRSPERVN